MANVIQYQPRPNYRDQAIAEFLQQMSQQSNQRQMQDEQTQKQAAILAAKSAFESGDYNSGNAILKQLGVNANIADPNAAVANAFDTFANPPSVDQQTPIMGRSLGDLSNLAGVKGTMPPGADPVRWMDQQTNAAANGQPTGTMSPTPTVNTNETPTGFTETTQRKMTTEEMLPIVYEKLLRAGVPIDKIESSLGGIIGRRDVNEGAAGYGSPYQKQLADMGQAKIDLTNAQAYGQIASADNKLTIQPKFDYTPDEVASIAEAVGRGDYATLSDAVSGRDPTLKPMIQAYMEQHGLRAINPKLRDKLASAKSAESMLEDFSQKWSAIESTKDPLEKLKMIANFKAFVSGVAPSFRSAVGDAGAFTNADRDYMMSLFMPGTISMLADAFTKGKSYLPQVQERLKQTKGLFDERVSGYFGGYYGTWKQLSDKGINPIGGTAAPTPTDNSKDPLGIL